MMIEVLEGKHKDTLIDCARIANNGESPITYADYAHNDHGIETPMEVILTH
jgi:hypothetical protein